MWRAATIWCAVTGGAAALAASIMFGAMRAGANASAFAASAVAVVAMALLPPVFARRFGARATLPCAAALVLTTGAMSFAATQARAGVMQDAISIAIAGLALLIAVRRFDSNSSGFTLLSTRAPGFIRPGNGALIGAALLAGMSSGVLARFQLFALCGAGPFSLMHLFLSLCAVIGASACLQRIERRHALAWLFSIRGALLAALTLDALAPWSFYAAPAFGVLDALTLPTLLRDAHANHPANHPANRPANHTAPGGCSGVAHHVGMLAGAAFATTSWGFGQGFCSLFLGAAALNLICASAQMTRSNRHSTSPYFRSTPSSGIDFR
ncbi:hypothetical protein F4827_000013 [Paraburkholderia bannensis]|uniref:Uncharacterized protein n=1 Tax=Paraburkholderia bannensis TaxID=765414 RepID=A0A7W9TSE4_9BURK|nr:MULTISPECIES: hypothetical protein [Paraburkholderia]MBB3255780.1 hypothetical protein [Paraburkholderia sp. WP4_3_2]MBB6100209.1 hypothetical protein [Paraburkholderia bannensis]